MSTVVPDVTLSPYPMVSAVLVRARRLILDSRGEILPSGNVNTDDIVNAAYRRLQAFLNDNGVEGCIKDYPLAGLPAASSGDPSNVCFLSWDGYWNGSTLNEAFALPQDLVDPTSVVIRNAGFGDYFPLPLSPTTLNLLPVGSAPLAWEWHDNKLFLRGGYGPSDLIIRYKTYYPDLTSDPDSKILIMRSLDAMAYSIAAEYSLASGGDTWQAYDAKAKEEMQYIVDRTAARRQQITFTRIPRS